MAFQFNQKKIWIISPQPWGQLRVSKHHYASALAAKGNKVFFINPPSLEAEGIEVKNSEEENLFIVTYHPVFRGKKFLPGFIYNILLKTQVKRLRKALGKPDVVWCFQEDVFGNLNWFDADIKIYHQVDLSHSDLPTEAKTSHFNLAVSETIVNFLKPAGKEVFFINHGLNKEFAEKANQRLQQLVVSNGQKKKLKVGYVGNLMIESIDRETMMNIIRDHPDVEFIFWGPYEQKDNNLGGYYFLPVFEFVRFLKQQPNVVLKGTRSTTKLLNEIDEADMFWLCWKLGISKIWDGSNSHKIIEYLSTGKPVVSHHVHTYVNMDLFYMLPGKENDHYKELFDTVLDKVKEGEPILTVQNRIGFALENSYEQQLDRIEKIIQESVPGAS